MVWGPRAADGVHICVAVVIKTLDTVDRGVLDCVFGRPGYLGRFREIYFVNDGEVRMRSSAGCLVWGSSDQRWVQSA